MADVKIKVTNMHKSFGDLHVLKGFNIEVHKGEVVAIIGPSGGGKSTILRCLNKLEDIQHGTIEIDGTILCKDNGKGTEYIKGSELRRLLTKMAMVFQQFNLFPHMTVLENLIEAPINVQKRKPDEVVAEAKEILAKVGLESKADAYPMQLSGGQQQRVAIARALCMKPEIMLFDEPTSALDPELTGEVLKTMKELAAEKTTMIVVTHEIGFAHDVAHKVIFMDQGVARVVGTPEEVLDNPTDERLQNFLKVILD